MTVSVDLGESLEELALRIAELVAEKVAAPATATPWVGVAGASEHLATTEASVRALVKRREIPFHKVAGRLRFDLAELNEWVRQAQT
jgi:excisionase family DNA binding protein